MNTAQQMTWLVRREFWEHRGGLVWAPAVVGGLYVLLTVAAVIWAGQQVMGHGPLQGLPVTAWLNNPAVATAAWGQGVQVVVYGLALMLLVPQAIVAFFYCLGALFDERKTRQALFWKSLPLSDGATVASKALTVLVALPLVHFVVLMVASFVVLVGLSVVVMAHGGSAWTVLWGHGGLLVAWAQVAMVQSFHVLWALPVAAGWLLCSALAPRMPFLWGVMVLVALAMIGVMIPGALEVVSPVLTRAVTGFVPLASFLSWAQGGQLAEGVPLAALALDSLTRTGTWVGLVVGVGCLVAATVVRRRREEG